MNLMAAIYALIAPAVAPEVLIYSDQNSPRPTAPYWTLRGMSVSRVGTEQRSAGVSIAGVETVTSVRQATVQVQRFGDGSENACLDLLGLLETTAQRDAWSLAGLACYDFGRIQNLPQQRDESSIEARSSVDLFIRFASVTTGAAGAIETVEIAGAYQSKPDLSHTITVSGIMP